MSFDIFFQTGRFSSQPVVKQNPFTGQPQTILPQEPLSDAEVKAVQEVFERVQARGLNEDGCYVVELQDGGEAEVDAHELNTGCMVALRGITPHLVHFLFELLKAGNWVMLPAVEDAVAITTSPGSLKGVPEDSPRIAVCHSADELGVLLGKGVRVWQKYRDQVVDDG